MKLTISPRTHPIDHRSDYVLYSDSDKIISGALYHRETTWLDNYLVLFYRDSLSYWRRSEITFFWCLLTKLNPSSLNSYLAAALKSELMSLWGYSFLSPSESLVAGENSVTFLLFSYLCSSSSGMVRASPKSHTFTAHSLLIKMFAGFISLCIMLAEWIKLMAHMILYKIVTTWSSVKDGGFVVVNMRFKSCSTKSRTKNTSLKFSKSSSLVHGNITSCNLVVKTFLYILDSWRKMTISLKTFLAW